MLPFCHLQEDINVTTEVGRQHILRQSTEEKKRLLKNWVLRDHQSAVRTYMYMLIFLFSVLASDVGVWVCAGGRCVCWMCVYVCVCGCGCGYIHVYLGGFVLLG